MEENKNNSDEEKIKKIKILKEEVRKPFKEIEKDNNKKEDDKKSEEDFIPEQETSGFENQSRPAEEVSPLLKPVNETAGNETLEQEVANVPTPEKEEEENKVYNAPDYGEEGYDAGKNFVSPETRNRLEVFGEPRNFDLSKMTSQIDPRINGELNKNNTSLEDYQKEIRRPAEEERRLPFDRSERKRRRLNI